MNRKKGRVEEEGEGRMVHSLKASKMGERGGVDSTVRQDSKLKDEYFIL